MKHDESDAGLHETDELFRLMVESARDYALFLLTPDGHVASWNVGAERIKGYAAGEIIGRHFACFYAAEDIAHGWPEHLLAAAAAEGHVEDQGWRVRKNGSPFWASVVISALHDAAGRLRGFSTLTRDITERRQAEREQQRAAERLRVLANASNDFALVSNDEQVLLEQVARTSAGALNDACLIVVLSDDQQWLIPAAIYDVDPEMIELERVALGNHISMDGPGMTENVIRTQQPVLIAVVNSEQLRVATKPEYQALIDRLRISSLICVPIRMQGVAIGVLTLYQRGGERPPFDQDDLTLAQDLADRAALAIHNARLFQQVQAELRERKQAELATREREQKLSALFDLLPVGISILDADRAVVYTNPALSRILDLPASDLTQAALSTRRYINAAGEPMLAEEFATVRALRERQAIRNVETGVVKDDGSVIWTSVSAVPVDFPDWRLVVVTSDITERKRAERAMQRATERLHFLADASRAFAESGGDQQGLLDRVARSAAEMLRAACSIRLLSDDGQWLDVAAVGHYDEASVASMQASIGPWRISLDNHTPAALAAWTGQPQFVPVIDREALRASVPPEQRGILNQFFPHSLIVIPLRLDDRSIGSLMLARDAGELPAFDADDLSLAQDLAERAALAIANAQLLLQVQSERALLARRVEERTADLSVANAELARAARLKDEFLANMSHELRTPLNSILGRAQALQEQIYGPLAAKQIEVLHGVEESGRHLLALINDILDLSKIEADKLDLRVESINVDLLCRMSLRMVAQSALQKHIGVTSTVDSSVETIHADERRLKQILVNLLSNAVKFTPEGGKIGLEVRGDAQRQTATFTVWDTGIGIAEADLPKLFQPFVQIDSRLSRQFEGAGLGLALVRRLAEAHNGSVALESAPGQGSRFSVTLPWQPANATTAPLPPAAHTSLPAVQQALVIEDSPTAAERIAHYLSVLGARVEVHPRGDGALEQAIALRPDVIVLDILLPDLAGWEVLRQLKAEPRTRAIPVLIISVVDEPERARALGAAAFMLKPVDREAFVQILRQALRAAGDSPVQTALVIAPRAERKRILLAEDSASNIELLEYYLNANGYEVIVARSGDEALMRARETSPAIILMDIQMPGMDGLEAIRHIRADASLRAIPIAALTALAMPGDRERCLAAGADEYLTKPVDLAKLLGTIECLLDR